MSQVISRVVVHGLTGLQGGSVARALAAAGYTVFSCSVPGPDEAQHARQRLDAAKAAGVKLFWSALESIQKLAKGTQNLEVPKFEEKAEIAGYVASLGMPYTDLYLGGLENLVNTPNQWKFIED